MAAPPKESLSFKVRRREAELILPAEATPHELKRLSDIDDQETLGFHFPSIQFYRYDEWSMKGRDPVEVIRKATAEALVYYYPLAGRVREVEGRKLVVECTGEGVTFIEADADIMLKQLGDALHPPFPCLEEMLPHPPPSFLHSPIILIQMTRLKCGGFIYAARVNHSMCDATGMINFMKAVGEMARGATTPSTLPVWDRHLLESRIPPQVTRVHHEYDQVKDTIIPPTDMIQRSFFFGPAKMSAIRKSLPEHLRHTCSTFEVLTAYLWRCRTLAMNIDPEDEVRLIIAFNTRTKFNPPLPAGYYGNATAFPAAVTTAGSLCSNPLGFALELIYKAKADVTDEYMRSVADFLVLNGRPYLTMVRSYIVSDMTRLGSGEVNFGFGEPVYSGAAKAGGSFGVSSFLIAFTSPMGEKGILMPICLPPAAMDTFAQAVDGSLNEKGDQIAHQNRSRLSSSL